MKRLLLIILLCGTFLAGYHVGRVRGAPDLLPYAQKCYAKGAAAYQVAAKWVRSELKKMESSADADQGEQDQQGS